ncbi:zinc-binding dehydrogenase [Sphingomonas sp. NFR04]|uniref:zinc-binding dehydrogenase n=1 Tax=Sphingomonas sp. NFR04 TaxID=1566283 RepID=UPI0034A34613
MNSPSRWSRSAPRSRVSVLSIDPVPHARALAHELSADLVVPFEDGAPEAAILAMTDGRGADIVFECSGGETMPQTLPLATRMGGGAGRSSSSAASTKGKRPFSSNGTASRCRRSRSFPAPASPSRISMPNRPK